jgi:hypothetical protein
MGNLPASARGLVYRRDSSQLVASSMTAVRAIGLGGQVKPAAFPRSDSGICRGHVVSKVLDRLMMCPALKGRQW